MSDEKNSIENYQIKGHQPEEIDYGETDNVSRVHEQIRREKSDPDQGNEPLPLWGIGFVMVILAGAFMYFGMFSGGFRGDVYDHRAGAGIAAAGDGGAVEEVDPLVAKFKLGKRVYQTNCNSCHQATGNGVAGQYPPLVGSRWVLENDDRLTAIILGGLQGPIEVKGNIYNNAMVAWAPTLSDKEVAAVTTYIRQEWGNQGTPITEEQVAAVRAAHSRSETWTADELIQVFGD